MNPSGMRILLVFALFTTGLLSGCHQNTHTRVPKAAAPLAPIPAPLGPIHFVDKAAEAGLDFYPAAPAKRPINILSGLGSGCAFLDYDNDGNLDVLLIGPKPQLYRGDGRGHFKNVTDAMGLGALSGHFEGCATGDYDNDGFSDIYLSAYRGGVLLHNVAGHRFDDVTASAGIAPQPWGTSCSFGDVDGDGKLDLYIANYVVFGPDTQPQLCDFNGTLSACGPKRYHEERGVLYQNTGGGKFRDVTGAWGAQIASGKALGVAMADYNASGKQAIALANDEMPGDLLERRDGKFYNVGSPAGIAYDSAGSAHGGMGIDWGDYDNDGKLDLVVAAYQHEPTCIYHNEGNSLFTERAANLGIAEPTIPNVTFGAKWLDADNDGWLDLMLANGHIMDNIDSLDPKLHYRQPTQFFHNTGHGGKFEDWSATCGPDLSRRIVGRGLATGDYDNDGRVDALVTDLEGRPLLLHNESVRSGHWLSLKLIGSKSNRDGIGAAVTLTGGGVTQTRRCGTDGSYLSASDRRIHLGLGERTSALITVRWPSGRITKAKAERVDRTVVLRE